MEERIKTFISTAETMVSTADDSGDIQQEMQELDKKWSTFQMQVGDSQKLIELSIDYFKLIEEVSYDFKEFFH